MPRGFLRKDNLTKKFLLGLALTGGVLIAATSPYFLTSIARELFKSKQVKNGIKKLKELMKHRIIKVEQVGPDKIQVTLSKLGWTTIKKYNFDSLKLQKPKRWDGKWRLIIYDIPSSKQKASQALSYKLHDFGLYQLQKSVWISPYDCKVELELICDLFDLKIDDHIHYFITREIPKEKEVKSWFKI